MKKFLKFLKYFFITIFFVVIFFLVFSFFYKFNLEKIPYSSVIYDKNNIEIWEIIAKKNNESIRHRKLSFNEIPEFTKKAIIAMEDKNFYSNIWIDFFWILRALKNNFENKKILQWASTISSGLIRNIYWTTKKRTYLRKAKEFFLAIILNIKYSKKEILTHYLNNIYFWNLNYWLKSASYFYFWKNLKNLTKAEQLALLIIPKNPTKYNPLLNRENHRKIFEQKAKFLYKNKIITKQELNDILREKIFFNYSKENKLPYIVDYLKEKNIKKQKIFTTIDYNLTKQIKDLAKQVIIEKSWKNLWDYSLILVDRKTTKILVMIWGYNYFWKDWQLNSVFAKRQPGSTIKPFTYLLAMKDLNYSPDTIMLDLPTQFKTKEGYSYNPKNYSLKYSWKITLAWALSQSINVVSIALLEKVWVDRLYNFLKKLKINSLDKSPEYYWLALTLWDWELSLFELVRAYTIFAYDGKLCDFRILKTDKKNCKQIIEKKYTDKINFILTNRYFKLKWFPVNSALDFPKRKIFVKTWTSRNFRDNWAIWYSKNYILWVWAWNKDGSAMKWVSWATWAWEIFSKVIKFLEPEENDFIRKKVVYKDKKINFLKIISPLDGSVYQIDEFTPRDYQAIKIKFETDINYDTKKIFINKKEYKKDIWQLKKWEFLFEIVLYKNNIEIKKQKSFIKVI